MPTVPPYIDLRAAGSMVCDVPAHKMGTRGSAYRYGVQKVYGTQNMLSNGEVLRSIIIDKTGPITGGIGVPSGLYSLKLGGIGVGSVEQIFFSKHVHMVTIAAGGGATKLEQALVNCNGEMCYEDTTAATYGGIKEGFTMGGITATVIAGSQALVFSASIAALTLPGYAYTPNLNAPRNGDLVGITQGGNVYFHRLITGAAANWAIYPAWNGTNAAGLACTVYRTGWGSMSRVVFIAPGGGLYYCGNLLENRDVTGFGFGTIECVTGVTHLMSPKLSPSGAALHAVDIAYFKNFLLYGAGHVIGWSTELAPFPSTPGGFGANDFLDTSVNAGFTDDRFVGFEYLGDQVVALFQNSAYLVQATGDLPAFQFLRLTQSPGVYNKGVTSFEGVVNAIDYTRPMCHSSSSVFFASSQGIMEIRGAPPGSEIGTPINSYEWIVGDNTFILTYDPASDSVVVSEGNQVSLLYRRGDWSELNLTQVGVVRAVTGGITSKNQAFEDYRRVGIGFWDPNDKKLRQLSLSMNEEINPNSGDGASYCPWSWASPAIELGAVYDGFNFGGFQVIGRAAYTGVAPKVLTWTLWGGQNPYSMVNVRSGTFDYKTGHRGGRSRIGGVSDLPYIAVTLTGSFFIELWGVRIYPADTDVSR